MGLTWDEKQVIKDHYDFYIDLKDASFEHILEMSVGHMILEGVVNLTEDEDGLEEKKLIENSRNYLNHLFDKKS